MARRRSELPDGFQNIALSFSGGGFRAAAFTLGCASYLHATPYQGGTLFGKVRFISSASGGTITNLVLAAFLRRGQSFEEGYKHLVRQMMGTELLDEAMALLDDPDAWTGRPEKSRNLINAFAMVYDEKLFEGAEFGLLFKKPDHNKFFIEEICANTTDLTNGLNFRFGTKGEIGNTYLKCRRSKEHQQSVLKIKLADILAASSCFPGGFEPIMYPLDFAWKKGGEGVSAKSLGIAFDQSEVYNNPPHLSEPMTPVADPERKQVSMAFMDGGIDDNQGIYAFLMADDRRKAYNYDLYLPCDVSSNYLEHPFTFPKPGNHKLLENTPRQLFSRFNFYRKIYFLLTILLGLTGAGLLIFTGAGLTGAFLLGMFLVLEILLLIFNRALSFVKKRLVIDQQGTWGRVFKKHIGGFGDIPVNRLVMMVSARASSVFLLVGTVFLKKIRRMSYDYLYSEKSRKFYGGLIKSHNNNPRAEKVEAGVLWNDHFGMTAVYLLATKNNFMLMRELKAEPWNFETATVSAADPRLLKDVFMPTDRLRKIIDSAAAMSTTLWFDDQHMKSKMPESLIVAGQATACFNLLRISLRFSSKSAGWKDLHDQLLADWDRFREKPTWLYETYSGD